MTTRRQRQVAELLHEEISQLIQYRAHDPRLGFVTVTRVEVSPDLRHAKVFVSVLGSAEEAQTALEGLTSASRFFRRELGQALSLRVVPDLSFRLDTSLEHALQIDRLLDEIQEELARTDEQPADDEPAE
ncbi:MAG: 30S ribosome-binding factor RbfA [Chloroflexi bacterium]|nr:MAG: 30S ribosome-binding factor RbfA [Chloroflexota bacterium]